MFRLRQLACSRHVGDLRNEYLWRRRYGAIGLGLPFSLFNQVSPTAAATFAALCPTPYTQAGCPCTRRSSGADVTNELSYQFLGQDLKSNKLELQYDFTKRWTGRLDTFTRTRSISQFSATFDTGETYFPGGTGASLANDFLAARGDCALVGSRLARRLHAQSGWLHHGRLCPRIWCRRQATTRRFVVTNIGENAAVAGFSGRPMDALSITGDFVFRL